MNPKNSFIKISGLSKFILLTTLCVYMFNLIAITVLLAGIKLPFMPTEKHITVDEVVLEYYYNPEDPEVLKYKELIFYEYIILNSKLTKVVRSWIILYDDEDQKVVDWMKIGEYYVFTIRVVQQPAFILNRDILFHKVRTKVFSTVHNKSELDLERQNRKIIDEHKRHQIW